MGQAANGTLRTMPRQFRLAGVPIIALVLWLVLVQWTLYSLVWEIERALVTQATTGPWWHGFPWAARHRLPLLLIAPGCWLSLHFPAMTSQQRCRVLAFGLLLPVHASLVGWLACRCSPTTDEVAHLSAGVRLWTTGRPDNYIVNPPLVKGVAALPVVLDQPRVDWQRHSENPADRSEWNVGKDFMYANGSRSLWYFTLARWACLPFSLIGMIYCYRWSEELFGPVSALVATTLWCFSPNLLGHAALITPDVAAASLGLVAMWTFRGWLIDPRWRNASLAGLLLGLVQLTKTSWIILFVLVPGLWLISEWCRDGGGHGGWVRFRRGLQLLFMLATGLTVLNLGYGGSGSLRQLGEYQFHSRMFAGPEADIPGNRFRDTGLHSMPTPVPASWLQGIDLQRRDFEGGWRPMFSYLRGEHRLEGWWYYYLYGLCVKLPLGTWLIALAGLSVVPWKRLRESRQWQIELLCLLLPPLCLFVFVSSQTGFSRHFRYVLPCLPFAMVLLSGVWRERRRPDETDGPVSADVPPGRKPFARWVATIGLVMTLVASLSVYPHSLAFFNSLAGGSRNGHRHLLDSNLDWGQDLYHLRDWRQVHPHAEPFHLAYSGVVDPRQLGIPFRLIPGAPGSDPPMLGPGWYAVSVNHLMGYDQTHPPWTYFQQLRPTTRVGASLFLYHLPSPGADDPTGTRIFADEADFAGPL